MVNEVMEKSLNEQVNAEFYSAYLYLSMAAYFKEENLDGFANWMTVQAQEERDHAMKLFDYIIRRGAKVTLTSIDEPQTEWDSPLAAFEHVLKHERYVTSLINNLVDLSIEQKDHATNNFLQWYVNEQVEEEENAMDNLGKLKLADGNPQVLYSLNEELATRVYTPIPQE
ncbi:MAG: ferritin [Methanobrevibacter boviskoreani]|jgi:ferritin|uniref:ferritin n=1 Tax=Methanobrevibacter TaxID=2172 RepID=UPI0003348551|nr:MULTISPECIES: ferritin [Methanobrevibacter]AGN16669.1 ferritin-like domain-containing protein [Methanobrevibacter sp. AbM4]MCI6775624.1 ferritin [Methanobrevibacter boviskoreani]MCI6929949.1 ferritin [Methanobrevibacter boviskoreani]MDD6256666.1 ferritin [Methanobrevibacter boviskoreani]MDY5614304.1 ferritin [Methanobrevibacter boviskoreani]